MGNDRRKCNNGREVSDEKGWAMIEESAIMEGRAVIEERAIIKVRAL